MNIKETEPDDMDNIDNDIEVSKVSEPAFKYNYYSIEEFLDVDRSSRLDKHELHEGYIISMQGASVSHVRINVNLTVAIGSFLKGKTCDLFSNDLKTGILSKESITYPDLVIACGPLQFSDKEKDVLLNPTTIIEILSPSTEKIDRGNKYFWYRQIPSFEEYILIGSTEYYMYASRKQPNGHWHSYETNDISATLSIRSIDLDIPLTDIYRKVSF